MTVNRMFNRARFRGVHYYAPAEGGYVKYQDETGNERQPCAGMLSIGPTLIWRPTEPLYNLLRREYRRGIAKNQ